MLPQMDLILTVIQEWKKEINAIYDCFYQRKHKQVLVLPVSEFVGS